ncbi:MAG TPA: response regulator transcription factor [Mycobacteriales bacterium]|nr:response regulator transcription factor [Mycobacteriales bacterium]
MRLLVVDDEPGVRDAVAAALRFDGHQVSVAVDGVQALAAIEVERPDAVILDVVMPGLDGLRVCLRLRERGNRTPILALTARDSVADRVAGLDAGADDYLVKPFALDELLARVRALLRRTAPDTDGTLGYADLSLDPASRRARRGNRVIDLTRTEYALLELLLVNAGRVLPRDVIVERIWGYDFGPASNSLEVFVGYLRRKTEAGGEPRLVRTVRGVGYTLRSRT